MYPELDGSFPNHPADPIQPENIEDLQERVTAVGADVGLAFDGDADRVFLVDEKAQPLSGSLTTAMVAASILDKHPGEKVIHNLICSKAVPEVIVEHGGEPVRTRVGHSFIKAVMADTGAIFGGEHSGHYYFRDNYGADSGLIAALLVLELMSKADKPMSELRKPFERYADSGEINTEVDDPMAVIEKVGEAYADADQDREDGLTVDLGDWWFNLRPSNTEPLLRLNLEAPTREECDAHVQEVQERIKEAQESGATSPENG
jgi:phosphomannomutase